jgi:hypothetical protein
VGKFGCGAKSSTTRSAWWLNDDAAMATIHRGIRHSHAGRFHHGHQRSNVGVLAPSPPRFAVDACLLLRRCCALQGRPPSMMTPRC